MVCFVCFEPSDPFQRTVAGPPGPGHTGRQERQWRHAERSALGAARRRTGQGCLHCWETARQPVLGRAPLSGRPETRHRSRSGFSCMVRLYGPSPARPGSLERGPVPLHGSCDRIEARAQTSSGRNATAAAPDRPPEVSEGPLQGSNPRRPERLVLTSVYTTLCCVRIN